MVSEVQAIDETAGPAPAVSRSVAIATDILQALLLICVVGWVIDMPRRLLGLSLYTEQLLAVCLGLALALSFINIRFRYAAIGWFCPPRPRDVRTTNPGRSTASDPSP